VPDGVAAVAASGRKTGSNSFKDVTVKAQGSARSGATTNRHHGRRRYRHGRNQFGHTSHDCPVLKAKRHIKDKVAAIAAEDGSDSDDAICLVDNAADNGDFSKSSLVDSAASAHMCWMRA